MTLGFAHRHAILTRYGQPSCDSLRSSQFYSRAKLPVVGGLRENEIEELFKGQGLPYEGGWTVRGERRQSMQHKGGWTVSGRPTLQQRQNSGQVNAAVVDQERVVKVMETIGRLITLSVRSKILDAPAPIISRVFQVLSEGHERGERFPGPGDKT